MKHFISLFILFLSLQAAVLTGVAAEPEQQGEEPEQLSEEQQLAEIEKYNLGEKIASGLVPLEFDQWTEAQKSEFFKNVPPKRVPELQERYIALQTAMSAYWKLRGEFFTFLKPLYPPSEKSGTKQETQQTEPPPKHPVLRKVYDFHRDTGEGNFPKDAAVKSAGKLGFYVSFFIASFAEYPLLLNPADEQTFWNDWSDDVLFIADTVIDKYKKETVFLQERFRKFQTLGSKLTVKDIPEFGEAKDASGLYSMFYGMAMLYPDDSGALKNAEIIKAGDAKPNEDGVYDYRDKLPLPEHLKKRLANDEPLFHHPYCGGGYLWFFMPEMQSKVYLKEFARSRIAVPKIDAADAAKELAALKLTAEEIERWDASLSLHPFIENIAKHIGVDEQFQDRLKTDINSPSIAKPENTVQKAVKILSNTHPAIVALIEKKKDLVFSARGLSEDELRLAKEKNVSIESVPFAGDAFVFILNRYNPVKDLTLEQLQGIFSGKYKSWKEVNGFGETITAHIRNTNSGSEELMQHLVMKGVSVREDFKPKKVSGMSIMVADVSSDPTAIGYSIFHFVRYMAVDENNRSAAVNGIKPVLETIQNKTYPLVYDCVLLYRSDADERTKQTADFFTGAAGQALVQAEGFAAVR